MTLPTVRTGSVRIARLDRDQPTGDRRWVDLAGVGAVTFEPVLEQAADHYAEAMRLPAGATVTVAFTPSRAMVRLLFGWAATVDRRHVRRLYRARTRRSR